MVSARRDAQDIRKLAPVFYTDKFIIVRKKVAYIKKDPVRNGWHEAKHPPLVINKMCDTEFFGDRVLVFHILNKKSVFGCKIFTPETAALDQIERINGGFAARNKIVGNFVLAQ